MDKNQTRSKIAALYVELASTTDEEKCAELRNEISELRMEIEEDPPLS